MDCCGTGGSGVPRFNASTTSAFILAAGGVPTVKLGNRSISSRSGSFDLLECLGIPEKWTLTALPDILNDCGLVFLYAPQVYPDLAGFSRLRRLIGERTIFNYMGPLLNPIHPTYRLLGVSDGRMQRMIAEILRDEPRTSRAWVVRAENGLDEISPDGSTDVFDIHSHTMTRWAYRPEFQPSPFEEGLQHTPGENHRIFLKIISGEDGQSAYHRISCLNAGAGFYLAGKAVSLEEGTLMAEDLLLNRKVAELLDRVRRIYGRLH
jgi:anthranilate phosphoribosyltransferase